jgi:myo-inositol-1(or 4)-monophosphatase
MSEMLELAKSVAKIAGQNAMKYFGKEKSINNKSEVDLVTHVDIENEKLIVNMIKEKYPNHGFILEEGDDEKESAEYKWVIDPIDGTTSYAHNYPMFAINIGVTKNNKPIMGVVYLPFFDELFFAEIGDGAYLNDKKISVTKTNELSKSLIATGFPYTRITTTKNNLNYLKNMIDIVQGIRRSGSAAIDICFVACGRLDGYWELGLKTMDTLPAQVILNEAGGKFTDMKGKKIEMNYENIGASNGFIHDELITRLNK